MNPVDAQRLSLDAISQIKAKVSQHYSRKSHKSEMLLLTLDRMTSERCEMIRLKRKILKKNSTIAEMRYECQLGRMEAMKRVLEQSGWYYEVVKRMITEEISEHPLAKFMSGK